MNTAPQRKSCTPVLCAWLLLLLTLAPATGAAPAVTLKDKDCLDCHSDKDLKGTNTHGKVVSMFIDAARQKASAHGDQTCVDCHADIKDLPHADQLKPVNCGLCHADAAKVHLASVHGRASTNSATPAAACLDCHGLAHGIVALAKTNAPTFRANIPRLCSTCHANQQAMAKFKRPQSSSMTTYELSVHGLAWARGATNNPAVCTDCHGTHNVLETGNPAAKLFWQNIPATCGKCHGDISKTFDRSIHGLAVKKNRRDAPICTDCHSEHKIDAVKLAASRVSAAHIQETCGQCHKAERISSRYGFQTNVFASYVQSYHGLASDIGGVAAANCASCHGFHDILPSSDPASSVNTANLPKTCGKCHPGIGERVASGELKMHQPPGTGKDPQSFAVMLVTRIYLALIVLIIGGMVGYNLLDWVAKVREHVRAARARPGAIRLTRLMRAQHLCLVITFVLLAYTGFVHKYPEAWWSWPLRVLPDGSYVRGMIHRIAGWAFTGLFGVHLVLLFATARGREYLVHLGLRGHDIGDAWHGFLCYLRLRVPHHPQRFFNFAEKAEYWALIWGSFVMVITGIMLIFSTAVLHFLPKVWLDLAQVIHLYEAILATLAIVVWHFYWVIFDPHEYPMNTTWLLGHKGSKPEQHETDDGGKRDT